jgi:hypothetical protein
MSVILLHPVSRPWTVRIRFKHKGAKRARSVIRRVQAVTWERAHDLAIGGARLDKQVIPGKTRIIAVEEVANA